MAECIFESEYPVLCKVQLANGDIIEKEMDVYCYGNYIQWTEDMHPDGIGYYQTFSDWEIDEDTMYVKYAKLLEVIEKDELSFDCSCPYYIFGKDDVDYGD